MPIFATEESRKLEIIQKIKFGSDMNQSVD